MVVKIDNERDAVSLSLRVLADGGDKALVEQFYRATVQFCLQELEYSVSKLHGNTHDFLLLHSEETDADKLSRTGGSAYPEVRASQIV